jgi:hypothetical protein
MYKFWTKSRWGETVGLSMRVVLDWIPGGTDPFGRERRMTGTWRTWKRSVSERGEHESQENRGYGLRGWMRATKNTCLVMKHVRECLSPPNLWITEQKVDRHGDPLRRNFPNNLKPANDLKEIGKKSDVAAGQIAFV